MAQDAPLDMADLYRIEAANVQLVKDFLASWYEPHNTDISLLSPDGEYRSHDTVKERHTPDSFLAYLREHLPTEARIVLETHQIFAKGTLVVTVRTDIVRIPGRKDRIFEIVSDFTCKGGKIVEWTDHVYSWREAA